MHRNTYIKYLFRAGYCKSVDIINYVFPMAIPGDDSLVYENENITKTKINNYQNYI